MTSEVWGLRKTTFLVFEKTPSAPWKQHTPSLSHTHTHEHEGSTEPIVIWCDLLPCLWTRFILWHTLPAPSHTVDNFVDNILVTSCHLLKPFPVSYTLFFNGSLKSDTDQFTPQGRAQIWLKVQTGADIVQLGIMGKLFQNVSQCVCVCGQL